MATPTFTKTGTKATTAAKLDQNVFAVETSNYELLKLAYNAYLAEGRANLAITKTRGLVRGGGKKPWRQKGTGRARFGSSRVPQWRHGGIVFGPTGNENYTLTIPVKAKRQAIRQALSLASTGNMISVIEAIDAADGKTAKLVGLLSKIDAKGRILIVVAKKNDTMQRAAQNIPKLRLVSAKYLTVYDILNADRIIIEQDALKIVSDWLGTSAKKPATEAQQ